MYNLDAKGQIHEKLSKQDSKHIVRLIKKGAPIEPNEATGLVDVGDPKDWEGKTKRLLTVYCGLGDMKRLIQSRQKLHSDLWGVRDKSHDKIPKEDPGLPFDELTLWRFFDCLADGIAVMSNGHEWVYNPNSKEPTPKVELAPGTQWVPIVHFDIKPANSHDTAHPHTPILKIGCFGHSHQIPHSLKPRITRSKRDLGWDYKKLGSATFQTPEQMNSGWDNLKSNTTNLRDSQVAGIYGSHTNVWQVGLVMHHLALTRTYLNMNPFEPDFKIGGDDARGRTYGPRLRTTTYSDELKSLIFECLYEIPTNLPTTAELKQRIGQGIIRRIHRISEDLGIAVSQDLERNKSEKLVAQYVQT
ncbi:Protein kinase-like (PK-like) [Glarea lozoyensis ATCC 20868]|uniref:non-specific serine/threonine protein kinase n=1 Tax=Glarea lozoyensis (strain ATCC 20868 / MF5171) TaxID=1116229 RepID=S3DFY4_GLAL2|nr:Protein kinase-like (PK-like) [Glarea lozoyensis ATCC 20868]EPE30901.1 Protein kinase-like (PK-like) [Glarea lozoyensis ATCC 20868]